MVLDRPRPQTEEGGPGNSRLPGLRSANLLYLLTMALALGYVVWRSRSLLSGIAMHAANNLLGGLALIRLGPAPEATLDMSFSNREPTTEYDRLSSPSCYCVIRRQC